MLIFAVLSRQPVSVNELGPAVVLIQTLPNAARALADNAGVGAPQGAGVNNEFRGAGAAVAKSAALLFASVHPVSALKMLIVLLGAGAVPAPSKQFAVAP